jgi:hypothetical protein
LKLDRETAEQRIREEILKGDEFTEATLQERAEAFTRLKTRKEQPEINIGEETQN